MREEESTESLVYEDQKNESLSTTHDKISQEKIKHDNVQSLSSLFWEKVGTIDEARIAFPEIANGDVGVFRYVSRF